MSVFLPFSSMQHFLAFLPHKALKMVFFLSISCHFVDIFLTKFVSRSKMNNVDWEQKRSHMVSIGAEKYHGVE